MVNSEYSMRPSSRSLSDLGAVRRILAQLLGLTVGSNPALISVVNCIIEEAGYYPTVYGELRADVNHVRHRTIDGRPILDLYALRDCLMKGGDCAARLCVLTPPLPSGFPPEKTWRAKKVVWDIESKDQGWGGEVPGTFQAAFSWFEASIFRKTDLKPRAIDTSDDTDAIAKLPWDVLDMPYCSPEDVGPRLAKLGYTLVPGPHSGSTSWEVQRNRVAQTHFARYHIEWDTKPAGREDRERCRENGCSLGEGFVDTLRPGDCVALWMRAICPGWANYVRNASVKVLYDV